MSNYYNDQWRLPNNENKDKQSNYSMDFDGSQYIDLGTTTDYDNGDLSASIWVYASSTRTTTAYAFSNSGSSSIAGFDIAVKTNNAVRVSRNTRTKESGSGWRDIGFTDDAWQHLAFTYNESTNTIKLFLNGVLKDISIGTTQSTIASKKLTIGSYITTISLWKGKLDGASIFDYTLSDGGVSVGQTATGDIAALYGSSSTGIGNPMSLSPKPVAYYPLGDQDAFNGANYLVPNIAAQEADGDIATSYSPYALDFDGTNDYIQIPNLSTINTSGNVSISFWMKTSNTTTTQSPVRLQGSTIGFYMYSDGLVRMYGSTTGRLDSSIASNDGEWHLVVGVYGTSAQKLYIDNVVTASDVGFQGTIGTTGGAIGSRYFSSASNLFDGQISNCSVWNTALTSAQVSEIYNEGVPSNLNNHSAYSNLVSWWQLGSNSSFNTNWTVLDEKGSNNGTSVNMDEVDIVDGVGSYANGLSSGMGGDEVIGDAPYSSSNSLSVNMDVLDRTEDTPA